MSSPKESEIVMSESRAHMFAPVSIEDVQIWKECSLYCRLSFKVCLKNGYKNEALLCVECAEVCEFAVKFKGCHSQFMSEVFKLCIIVCQKTEIECSKLAFEQCQKCAEACRKCLKYIAIHESKKKS